MGSLCLECVAWTSNIEAHRIEAALPTLRRDFWVTVIVQGTCARCLRERDLLSIDR